MYVGKVVGVGRPPKETFIRVYLVSNQREETIKKL